MPAVLKVEKNQRPSRFLQNLKCSAQPTVDRLPGRQPSNYVGMAYA